MSVYRYPVNQKWIPGLPSISYRNGVGQYEGVVMHQTDNPDDTAISEFNFESSHWREAFVHEFVDPTMIVQVANPQFIAYGAGPHANARFVHLELCHAADQAGFDASYDAWCERAAEYLFAKQLGVSRAEPTGHGTLWSHYDVTHFLGGTTHEDPIAYLEKWGKTWDDVVARVTEIYNALGAETTQSAAVPVKEEATVEQWELDAMKWLKDNGLIEQEHDPRKMPTWAELGIVLQRLAEKVKGDPTS